MDLSKLEAAVARDRSVNDSAITLLTQLSTLLKQNANDPTAILALADQLETSQQALADAIVANTPAESTVGGKTGGIGTGQMREGAVNQRQQTQGGPNTR